MAAIDPFGVISAISETLTTFLNKRSLSDNTNASSDISLFPNSTNVSNFSQEIDLDLAQGSVEVSEISCNFSNQTCFDSHHSDNASSRAEEIAKLLAANDELAVTLLPVILFLGLLSILGVIGNGLVCYVFAERFRKGSQNLMIICLAVCDLLTCILTIPYEIVDVRFYAYYVFETDYICKIFKFVNVFCNTASIFILLIIAVDRYRKVCQPLDSQIRLHHIRIVLVFTLAVSTIYSAPIIFLYGFRTTESNFIQGMKSRDCSTPDHLKHSLGPTLYNGILFLTFIVFTVALIVLYTSVLREVKLRNRRRKSSVPGKSSQINARASSAVSDEEDFSTKPEGATCIVSNARRRSLKNIPSLLVRRKQSNKDANKLVVSLDKQHLQVPFWRIRSNKRRSYRLTNAHELPVLKRSASQKSKSTKETKIPTVSGKVDEEFSKINSDGPASSTAGLKENQNSESQEVLPKESATCRIEISQAADGEDINKNNCKSASVRRSASDVGPQLRRNSREFPANDSNTELHDVNTKSPNRPTIRRSKSETELDVKPAPKISRPLVLATTFLVSGLMPTPKKERSASSKKRRRARNRTTIVAFSVAAVFILSFLPHLSLMIVKLLTGFDQGLTGSALVIYNIVIRSYFINSVSNPFIYGILNSQFRHELKLMIKRLFHVFVKK